MPVNDPEALIGGASTAALVVLVRDLVGRLVTSSAPGEAEVQALRDRVLSLEHQLKTALEAIKNLEAHNLKEQEAKDHFAREVNRAVGGIHTLISLLEQERSNAIPSRK